MNTATWNGRPFNSVAWGGSNVPLSTPSIIGAPARNTSFWNGRAFNAAPWGGSIAAIPRVIPFTPATRPNTSTWNGRGWNVATWNGGSAVSTIRQAVVRFLRSIPDLTAIVGSRIYWNVASQSANYPRVVVTVSDRKWGHNLAGADGTSTATITFECQASSPLGSSEATSVAIAESIRNEMDNFRGIQAGVPILLAMLDDEYDEEFMPPDGSDSWIYQSTLSYRVVHRVPFPRKVRQINV